MDRVSPLDSKFEIKIPPGQGERVAVPCAEKVQISFVTMDLRDLYWWPGMKRDIAEYWLILPIREDYKQRSWAKIYVNEIVAILGIAVCHHIDRDGRFTSHLWQALQEALGTRLDMSTAYHPQTDGQSERTIQMLEDMLRACVMDFGSS
ncbi:putative reverse transcriptase domain-containing protein [Tanacetum coccineum]